MEQTCLYASHIAAKGKMVEFAGFEMPISYQGILAEHKATREAIGLFDVSHMGKFQLTGEGTLDALNYLITNDLTTLEDEQILYTPMCYEDGGTVDDILIYRYHATSFLIVVNAANKEKDFLWIKKHLKQTCKLIDLTPALCQIALQGPKASQLLQELTSENLDHLSYYWFKNDCLVGNIPMLISRTGYTGEDGFELYFEHTYANQIWRLLLEKGGQYGIQPCGLGARDTLRFEAGMPLYGNELTEEINPIEAGLSYFVKLDSTDFIGKETLLYAKKNKKRKLIGFELMDKGLPRHGAPVLDLQGNEIGLVTTGYKSPTFGVILGFALILANYTETEFLLQVRKNQLRGKIIPKRFLKTYTKA